MLFLTSGFKIQLIHVQYFGYSYSFFKYLICKCCLQLQGCNYSLDSHGLHFEFSVRFEPRISGFKLDFSTIEKFLLIQSTDNTSMVDAAVNKSYI